MNEELIRAFEAFLIANLGATVLAQWTRRIVQRLSEMNPSLRYEPLPSYMSYYPYAGMRAAFPDASRISIARTWASTIRPMFNRTWNRSSNVRSMLDLVSRTAPERKFFNYMEESEWSTWLLIDTENEDQPLVQLLEGISYDIGIGDYRSINDLALIAAGVSDDEYVRGNLSSSARKRVNKIKKDWADEIRDLLPRPDPRQVIR